MPTLKTTALGRNTTMTYKYQGSKYGVIVSYNQAGANHNGHMGALQLRV